LMPPLLLGHRGARVAGIPENTFAAFEFALANGCAGFEFDVRLTADGLPIVCHDPDIAGLLVSRTSYSSLIDNCAANTRGEPIPGPPLLEEVLARYGQRAFLDIELKVEGLEPRVAEALQKYSPKAFVVSSFLPSILRAMRRLVPGLPLGLISDNAVKLELWPDLSLEFVIPHQKLASSDLLKRIRDAGKKVLVWTVNERHAMRRLAKAGVDGVISDSPELLVRTLSTEFAG
jgi:glycerophosphoryl diester phosphodiesterase